MLKKIKERKEKKIKTFLFFLLLATVFWMLTKYSNEYTQSIISKIEYKNLPNNTILSKNNINEISFDVVANGFEFLVFKIKKPTINIDVSRFYSKENKQAIVTNNELKKLITSQLNKNILVRNISVNDIIINLNSIKSKKVPVNPNISVNYKAGYKNSSKPIVTPDSVLVSASGKIIDTLKQVTTQVLKIDEVNQKVEEFVPITIPEGITDITVSPRRVKVTIPVEEIVQKTIEVPVKLEHLPVGMRVKIVPEMVSVTYTTTVSNFNKIAIEDFEVSADYKNRTKDEASLPILLINKPKTAFDVTIEPTIINLLIVN